MYPVNQGTSDKLTSKIHLNDLSKLIMFKTKIVLDSSKTIAYRGPKYYNSVHCIKFEHAKIEKFCNEVDSTTRYV